MHHETPTYCLEREIERARGERASNERAVEKEPGIGCQWRRVSERETGGRAKKERAMEERIWKLWGSSVRCLVGSGKLWEDIMLKHVPFSFIFWETHRAGLSEVIGWCSVSSLRRQTWRSVAHFEVADRCDGIQRGWPAIYQRRENPTTAAIWGFQSKHVHICVCSLRIYVALLPNSTHYFLHIYLFQPIRILTNATLISTPYMIPYILSANGARPLKLHHRCVSKLIGLFP